MLNNNEINRLKEYITTCSPKVLYKNEEDKKWQRMSRFEKRFDAKKVVRLGKEGHLANFNENDDFFRALANGDVVSSSNIYYTEEDRIEYYEEHIKKFGYYLPAAYKKAIGWVSKDGELKEPYTLYSVQYREGYYDTRKAAVKHRDLKDLEIFTTTLYTQKEVEDFKAKNPTCIFSKRAEKMGILAPKYNHKAYDRRIGEHAYIIKYHNRHQIFILLQYCEDHGIYVRNGYDRGMGGGLHGGSVWNTEFQGNSFHDDCFVCHKKRYDSEEYEAIIQYRPTNEEETGYWYGSPSDFLDFEMFDWSETEKHFEEKNDIKVGDRILVGGEEKIVSKVNYLTDGYWWSDGFREDEAHIVSSIEYKFSEHFSRTVHYGKYIKL